MPPDCLPVALFHGRLSGWTSYLMLAEEWWNNQVGLPELFCVMGAVPGPDFEEILEQGIPGMALLRVRPDAEGAHVRLRYDDEGEVIACPVMLGAGTSLVVRERVIAHELGHLLGLAHDERDPTSVMYPIALQGPYVLGEEDRVALMERYSEI